MMKGFGINIVLPLLIRTVLGFHACLLYVFRLVRLPYRTNNKHKVEVLLTGTFYAENWIKSHILPLAKSKYCSKVYVIATNSVPPMEKVEVIRPPEWLIRLIGEVPARISIFFVKGFQIRPHIVGGFHLLMNGIAASLLGPMVGARTLYFCVGSGPTEVLHVLGTENRLFKKLTKRDSAIVQQLLRIVNSIDIVITMGTKAARFFKEQGIQKTCIVVSGGIDDNIFFPGSALCDIDIILVGRLVPVKNIQMFLHVVKIVSTLIPNVAVAVIGDGPLRNELEILAKNIGIEKNVFFTGHQSNIANWLRRAKLFVLTSDSEGLALSMMEAMMCGLPVVVSDVGDLSDLVENDINGYLVSDRRPEVFAEKICLLLRDGEKRCEFSHAARRAVEIHKTSAVINKWDQIIRSKII